MESSLAWWVKNTVNTKGVDRDPPEDVLWQGVSCLFGVKLIHRLRHRAADDGFEDGGGLLDTLV